MTPFRFRPSRRRSSPDDGIDDRLWALLSAAVAAAHEEDAPAHASTLLELERRFPTDPMVGVCVWFLLRRQVRGALRKANPGREDIAPLVEKHSAVFSTLIREGRERLERTLLTVFDLLPQDQRIGPGDAVVWGTAALGVMSSDPIGELSTARPQLAEWCVKYSDDLHELGLR